MLLCAPPTVAEDNKQVARRVAAGRAGDGAIDDTALQCGNHFSEGHGDRRGVEGFHEIRHGLVEHPDLLARHVGDARDLVAAPEHLRRVGAERQQLGIELLLHHPVHHRLPGITDLARGLNIECQSGEIAALEDRRVAGHLGDVADAEIGNAEFDQP